MSEGSLAMSLTIIEKSVQPLYSVTAVMYHRGNTDLTNLICFPVTADVIFHKVWHESY